MCTRLRILLVATAIVVLVGAFAPPVASAQLMEKGRTYVGSEICAACHPDYYDSLDNTAHTKKTQPANPDTVVMPVDGTVITTTDGKARFKLDWVGDDLYLTLYDLAGAQSARYRVDRVMGGTGYAGKQRLVIRVDENVNAVDRRAEHDVKSTHLISPVQFNHLDPTRTGAAAFNAYHPEHWYDAGGALFGTVVQASQFKNSWERRCVGCHATGADAKLDLATGMFLNESSEFNVWCEACHGPGSAHTATADPKKIVNPAKMNNAQKAMDICARCHIRGGNVGSGNFSTGYPAKVTGNRLQPMPFGKLLADWYTPGEGLWPSDDEATYGNTATEYSNSRSHHQQGYDYIQSKHWTNPFHQVQCWECHDTHSGGAAAPQMTAAFDDNTLCLDCHADHGFEDNSAIISHTLHSVNPTTSGASRCTSCHMPKTAKSQQWWTGFEGGDISSHTFEVIKPTLTSRMARARGGDVEAGRAIPNGCNGCHMDADFGVARWGRFKAAGGGRVSS